MIFNNDSMLDFRPTGFGFDDAFGYDASEIVITGRMPGALYVDDISEGQTVLEYVLPHEFSDNLIRDPVDFGGAAPDADGRADAPVVDSEGGAGLVAANDDDGPTALIASAHGKDEAPLVLIPAGDDGHLTITPFDQHDLAIPPVPLLQNAAAPTITVTAPTFDSEAPPVFIGGRAYQSLSFLILDTPFVLGDGQLPVSLRPTIDDLLGLTDDEDANAWVLPVGSGAGAWRLG